MTTKQTNCCMEQIKVGDVVERCTLMPAIIQEIKGDTVYVYDLSYVSKDYKGGSVCSLSHCGLRRISFEFAFMLLALGKDRIFEIYNSSDDLTDDEYDAKVKEAFKELSKREPNRTYNMDTESGN